MIHIIVPEGGVPRPALVVKEDLAIPFYVKPWGICCPVVSWQAYGLERPAYAVLSQPHHTFKKKRKIGPMDYDDRMRIYRASIATPALRKDLAAIV